MGSAGCHSWKSYTSKQANRLRGPLDAFGSLNTLTDLLEAAGS